MAKQVSGGGLPVATTIHRAKPRTGLRHASEGPGEVRRGQGRDGGCVWLVREEALCHIQVKWMQE